VAGIAGTAVALDLAERERLEAAARVAALRDRFEAAIVAAIPDVRATTAPGPRAPHIASLAFGSVRDDAFLMRLDLEGIAASAGSACAAGSLEPSHVVAALGLGPAYARGVIRFSLGRATTAAQLDRTIEILPSIVAAVRGNAALV
jgi:cysteine desulfurase